MHLKEATDINVQLSSLRTVIDALVKKRKHIPFRDSRLTMVLKHSFQGNTRTCLILAASPHMWNRAETYATMKFGQRAKKIKNKIIRNKTVSVGQLQKRIDELEQENANLKKQLSALQLSQENVLLTQQKSIRLTARHSARGGKFTMPVSPGSVDSNDGGDFARERLFKIEAKLADAEMNLERIRAERDDAFKYLKLLVDELQLSKNHEVQLSQILEQSLDQLSYLENMVSEDPENPHMFQQLTIAARKASDIASTQKFIANDKHAQRLEEELKNTKTELLETKQRLSLLERNEKELKIEVGEIVETVVVNGTSYGRWVPVEITKMNEDGSVDVFVLNSTELGLRPRAVAVPRKNIRKLEEGRVAEETNFLSGLADQFISESKKPQARTYSTLLDLADGLLPDISPSESKKGHLSHISEMYSVIDTEFLEDYDPHALERWLSLTFPEEEWRVTRQTLIEIKYDGHLSTLIAAFPDLEMQIVAAMFQCIKISRFPDVDAWANHFTHFRYHVQTIDQFLNSMGEQRDAITALAEEIQRKGYAWHEIDTDNDGYLSLDELTQGFDHIHSVVIERIFHALDSNDDMMIEIKEFDLWIHQIVAMELHNKKHGERNDIRQQLFDDFLVIFGMDIDLDAVYSNPTYTRDSGLNVAGVEFVLKQLKDMDEVEHNDAGFSVLLGLRQSEVKTLLKNIPVSMWHELVEYNL